MSIEYLIIDLEQYLMSPNFKDRLYLLNVLIDLAHRCGMLVVGFFPLPIRRGKDSSHPVLYHPYEQQSLISLSS